MAFDEAMAWANGQLTQTQALAAMTARLRLAVEGTAADPSLLVHLDKVANQLGMSSVFDGLDAQERNVILSFARSYLKQAVELVEDPTRQAAWSHSDPALLQAQGSASGIVATLIQSAGLGKPDARILDIGTGVAGLAIAMCEAFPESTVVGVDPWEPALSLARDNVAAAGLHGRITLHAGGIESFDDPEGFDLVWLPSFFIPEAVLDTAIATVHRLTRPGAEVVMGITDAGDDPLVAAIDDLITVRSGGTPLDPVDAIARLEKAGFSGAREVERAWKAPIRLVVAVRD